LFHPPSPGQRRSPIQTIKNDADGSYSSFIGKFTAVYNRASAIYNLNARDKQVNLRKNLHFPINNRKNLKIKQQSPLFGYEGTLMPIEIELKVRVEDPDALKERVSLLAPRPPLSFEKEDCYWTGGNGGEDPKRPVVRLRKEGIARPGGETEERALVTYKIKEVREGIEINDEREFAVSDPACFEGLLRRLGLEPGIRKNKRGWAWTVDNLHAELCEVSGPKRSLGWFLEIEILAADAGEPVVADSRKKLLDFLEKIDMPRDRIEERYYSDLLASEKD
jgi:adenylate cyclase class 2